MAHLVRADPSPRHSLHYVERFTLSDVCIAFHNTSTAAYRSQFISRQGERATIHGFSEFSYRYNRVASVRPADEGDEPTLRTCANRSLGVALYFQSNNIFHAMHHAPQDWEALRTSVRSGAEEPVFIPLVGYIAGAGARAWVSAPTWMSHTWEFTIRGLTAKTASEIGSDLGQLLSAPCTCFSRVVGSVGAFLPYANQPANRRLLRSWREAVISHARRADAWRTPPPALPDRASLALGPAGEPARSAPALNDMLYVVRMGTRTVLNDAEIAVALRQIERVRRVVMERMTLAQQMLLVSSATVLIGVHGQALSHMAFLPWPTHRAALVEIQPRPSERSHLWTQIYPAMCKTQQTRHIKVIAEPDTSTAACRPNAKRKGGGGPLRCNVTVPVSELLAGVRTAAEYTRTSQNSASLGNT